MKSYARRTRAQWEALVAEQCASQLSAPQFCKQHEVAYASFSKWRTKLKKADVAVDEPEPITPFMELTAPTTSELTEQQWHIELDLAPGVQLRIAR